MSNDQHPQDGEVCPYCGAPKADIITVQRGEDNDRPNRRCTNCSSIWNGPYRLELYVATIQVAVAVHPGQLAEAAAADVISSYLAHPDAQGVRLSQNVGGEVVDWAYLRIGGQYLHPTSSGTAFDAESYEEGEAFK